MSRVLAVSALTAVLFACGPDQTVQELEVGMATASAIGRTTSLALEGMKATTPCATVTKACTTFPCDGAVSISLSAGCPLFIGGEASGSVTVSGQWTSLDEASLTSELTDVKATAAQNGVAVAKVTTVRVQRQGNEVSIRYTGSNATARGGFGASSVAAANTWDIVVDTKGTTDPADDDVTIDASSAGGSAGLGATAKVVNLNNVKVTSACRLNPVAGTADVVEVSGVIPKIVEVEFHATCDGKAEVNGSPHQLNFFP
ncbi:MAG: hypothetical protein AB1938_18925 [Myxococcota bacterium]